MKMDIFRGEDRVFDPDGGLAPLYPFLGEANAQSSATWMLRK